MFTINLKITFQIAELSTFDPPTYEVGRGILPAACVAVRPCFVSGRYVGNRLAGGLIYHDL